VALALAILGGGRYALDRSSGFDPL